MTTKKKEKPWFIMEAIRNGDKWLLSQYGKRGGRNSAIAKKKKKEREKDEVEFEKWAREIIRQRRYVEEHLLEG